MCNYISQRTLVVINYPWPNPMSQVNDVGITDTLLWYWGVITVPSGRFNVVRSRKASKARDRWLEFPDCFEIWQASRQQCCRGVCQISKRYDNFNTRSRAFEASRDLTNRRLMRYWIRPQIPQRITYQLWWNVYKELLCVVSNRPDVNMYFHGCSEHSHLYSWVRVYK